ncbi:hypothetical protein DVH05_006159 [Phytophthora capsici]|nr:hypothetical protein DVH05_006159 [Phytophthora capsici]
MTQTLLLRLLCLCAALGAYLCSSGLLRLNEVFFQSSVISSSNWGTQNAIQIDQQKSEAAYDRLVVVLIDALRADMVLGSAVMHGNEQRGKQVLKEELNTEMPFTSGLVTSGKALGYVAHASVPTVTMPRLKALVTGKAPAFIDILKNFNSAALDEDANLVSLLTANGKRIVFYGDDTWLKLFPESFKRSDGTSGFYTRDTVEVDLNVTRHLSEELDPSMQNGKSGDWDALVLHYLGLDHVGHLRGPRSPLMKDKLHEMDDVVKVVVDSVRSQDAYRMRNDDSARPSLILVCSDHGMSEVGNHGGATLEESSALLMFMRGDGKPMHSSGEASYKQKRNQVDLVPTISSLFGLSIPLYSTGLMLEDVVRGSFGSTSHGNVYYLRALYRNFQQLHALAGIKFHQSELASFDEKYKDPLHKLRRSIQRGGGDGYAIEEQTAAAVLEACEILQAKVAESDGSEYNSSAIFSGLALLFVGGVTGLLMLTSTLKGEANTSEHRQKHLLVVLVVGGVLWIASLSSSSSIENEHATAFFMTTTLLIAAGLVVLQHKSSTGVTYPISVIALLLVLTRMLRARNQIINFWRLNGIEVDTNVPGNEFASDDSVSILSTAALLPSGILPLGASVALIGGIVLRKAAKHIRNTVHKGDVLQLSIGISSGLFFLVGMVACLRVKELSDPVMNGEVKEWKEWIPLDADTSAQVVYACVVFLAALAMVSGRNLRFSLLEMSMWLLVGLLQRVANFPTLTLICLQMEAVAKLLKCEQVTALRDSGVVVAGLALWLSQAAFFALGNSHLVTTIDISQSYHGLSSYSQSLVGALTFVSVFSGPLVCFVNLFQWLDAAASPTLTGLPKTNTRRVACLTLLSYQVLRFAVYTIVVYLMRFHLFIWSVFAPKMLYEFAHLAVSLVLVLLLNC